MTENILGDKVQIRSLINDWAIWRDTGAWERLRTVWHPGGTMHATWFSGDAGAFVDASELAARNGLSVFHQLSGCSIDVRGDRAVAQTRMTIAQRATVHGVVCDAVAYGRFYDLFEHREGRWGLTARHPVYERDRLDPVRAGTLLELDEELLASLPDGYRYLAYVQLALGMKPDLALPGVQGPALEALYRKGQNWLAGA